MNRYDIAIIGMGCVFPGANDVPKYWKNIQSGASFFSRMPDRLWHFDNFCDFSHTDPEKSYTAMGAFIEGFDFPFESYKLPPNLLRGVDPAQLVSLEAAREALRDAGIEPRSPVLAEAATIVGSSGVDQFAHSSVFLKRHEYLRELRRSLEAAGAPPERLAALEHELAEELQRRGHVWNPALASIGAITSSLSNRVAQVFGIRGFNMTVDAACASSFVALDTACQTLMAGDARIVVAGGTDLGTNPAIYIGFSCVEGLSKSGKSAPFDHTADGLIIGEGTGMLVLKRLEDALADGDRIHAVIRGIGSSSDGAGQAIYAPSMEGRVEALRAALECAAIEPAEVQYLEAHATSTVVGDANEYDAISTVYAPGRDARDPLLLGSVKQQIGHLKAAAGVAGLIKTVLGMEHGLYPHMPRFTKLTPGAEKPSPALVIPTELRPWEPRSGGRRVAAVTSSGFGGVNYHVIVEQAPAYSPPAARPAVPREVAIVGVTCRVAGADTPEKFWDNLRSEADVFAPADARALGWTDHLDAGPENERITTRVVSRTKELQFNLLRHKIFPNAVSQIAPTQFLGLDLADRLLQQAGFDLPSPKRIGVSIGAMHDDYFPTIFMPMAVDEYAASIRCCPASRDIDPAVLEAALAKTGRAIKAVYPPVTEHTLPGWMANVIAGRMANKLNLHGPNFTVDSACSSSLGALMPAVYQLMFGNVDLMVSGGLNQQLSDTFTCGVCALGAVAEKVARPYDAEGQGFLIGEGGVLFLLKRLADAKRDGDPILAVIHAVGGSSEADSKTMVAPTVPAVRRSIRSALAKTRFRPEEIAVVDTHGSANKLSDIVEATSLAEELRPAPGVAPPVQITAVKSHVGHLYGGAAASSLFSTIQALRTGIVPAIRKLENVRPELLEIADRAAPRKGQGRLPAGARVGGVNSLGLGGANYFAVVSVPEDAPAGAEDEVARPVAESEGTASATATGGTAEEGVFLCAAESERELDGALGRALAAAAVPLRVFEGSRPGKRLAVTFKDEADLRAKLGNARKMLAAGRGLAPLESQGVFLAAVAEPGARRDKLAFCFPGQGTHYVSMGRFLYDRSPIFRRTLDVVDAAVRSALGFTLLDHIHGNPDDPRINEDLGTLVGAQTCLFAVEVAMARVLGEMGVAPDVAIGHSFGEISALTAAGVWDIDTALRVVAARIRAAETVIRGGGPALGMASVICSEEQRGALLGLAAGKVVLSNINGPGRYVFSGEKDAVQRVMAAAESFGVEARLLPIGAAFHTRFMEPAREPFRQALLALPCRRPTMSILSTVTGEYIDPARVTAEFLAEHLSSQLVTQLDLPREVNRLYADGVRCFLEVGPGWSMTKMVSAILEGRSHRAVPTLHPKVGDEETFRRARAFLLAEDRLGRKAKMPAAPGALTPDFLSYLERREPAVLALLREAQARYGAEGRSPIAVTTPIAPATPAAPQPVPAARAAAPVSAAADTATWVGRVRDKLVKTTGYPPEMLEAHLDLEADLGVDSVQRAEIWIALAREHGLDAEARPSGIRTIAQFAESLAGLAGGGQQAPVPAAPAAVQDTAIWVGRVRDKLVKTTGYPPEMLEAHLDLEADLGVDSVQRAEIWIALAREHGLDAETRPSGIRTIAQFAESLAGLAGGGRKAPAEPARPAPIVAPAPAAATAPVAVPAPAAVQDAAIWVGRVRDKLVKTTGYPPEMLEAHLDLEADLGVDSVQRAEIWIALAREHGLDAETRPSGIRTIAQFAESFAVLEAARAPSPGAASARAAAALPPRAAPIAVEEVDPCRLFALGERPLSSGDLQPFACRNAIAIVARNDRWAESLVERLSGCGVETTVLVAKSLLEQSGEEVRALLAGADTIIYASHRSLAAMAPDGSGLRLALRQDVERLYKVFRLLAPLLTERPLRVVVPVAEDGVFGASEPGNERFLGAFPAAFVRCLARELPTCRFQLVDAGGFDWIDAVERAIHVASPGIELGLGSHGWFAPILAPLGAVGELCPVLAAGDEVLVTGGARGIVLECVRELALRTGCRLILTGRTELPQGSPSWLEASPEALTQVIRSMEIELVRGGGMPIKEAKRIAANARAQWELNRNLARLARDGVDHRYEVCDVASPEALAGLIARTAKQGAVRGVVHGAGVQRSRRLVELEDSEIARTLDTKLNPVFTLIDALDWSQVKLLVGFGSITGLFGNAGQTDYALANDMLGWLIGCIGAAHPHVQAQIVDWTAWTGTGMVTDEEARRFAEAGLKPLDVERGVRLFVDAVLGTRHPKLAAFNAQAGFAAGRTIAPHHMAARPRAYLLDRTHAGPNARARFDLAADVYLDQHRVEHTPVVPGTFISEIIAEALGAADVDLVDVRFRRPLAVREPVLEVEVVRDSGMLLVLPAKRPALDAKGLANLAFSTAGTAPREGGAPEALELLPGDLEAIDGAGGDGAGSFYGLLDAKFSAALDSGPVFRGIRATAERDGRFLAAVRLTREAVCLFDMPGELVFNPVLADMAVQAAAAWNMLRHDVMAIPVEIGRLHVASASRSREAIVICRAQELGPERAVVDLAVRERDGRLVLRMDRLALRTISQGKDAG